MHPNPAYRQTDPAISLKAARRRGFGLLSINGEAVPLCSHIPFLLSKDGTKAEAHLVRSNPIAAKLANGPVAALLAVNCGDGYISPDWYQIEDQVPTWNYVAVHLTGKLRVLPPENLRPHLERLSDFFERRLAPKPVWRLDKVPPEVQRRLMRMIVPVELSIETVDATWKLAQNKDAAVRVAAADALEAGGPDAGAAALAALMRNPPDQFA